MKPKSELMQRLRDEREAQGLKRVEFWIKPEHKAKIKAYIKKLMEGKI